MYRWDSIVIFCDESWVNCGDIVDDIELKFTYQITQCLVLIYLFMWRKWIFSFTSFLYLRMRIVPRFETLRIEIHVLCAIFFILSTYLLLFIVFCEMFLTRIVLNCRYFLHRFLYIFTHLFFFNSRNTLAGTVYKYLSLY